jgi:hypothetical protein
MATCLARKDSGAGSPSSTGGSRQKGPIPPPPSGLLRCAGSPQPRQRLRKTLDISKLRVPVTFQNGCNRTADRTRTWKLRRRSGVPSHHVEIALLVAASVVGVVLVKRKCGDAQSGNVEHREAVRLSALAWSRRALAGAQPHLKPTASSRCRSARYRRRRARAHTPDQFRIPRGGNGWRRSRRSAPARP